MRGRALEPVPFDARALGDDINLIRPPIPEFCLFDGMMIDRRDINHLLAITKNLASFRHSIGILAHYGLDRLKRRRGTRLVMGNALIGRLLLTLRERKVSIVTQTEVEGFITGARGVEGVVLRGDGVQRRILASRGVVLAAGGFTRHPTRRADMLPGPTPEFSPAAPGHTGAMQDLALKLGARFGEGNLQPAFWAPVSIRKRKDGSTAVFFGLSGTGKTTLSADASRTLIGDDEHGWSDTAVFNFEGGCYAKVIRLSAEAEPEIFATTKRFGTILENVVIDPETRKIDLDDASLAENSRGSYPIDFIPNTSEKNLGPVPANIIFLTADAYGVLPPIARLTPDQAMYHFLSGYTARVAGTEIGVTEPEATFSTCFGAPFMPRHPSIYGNLLKERIAKGGVKCWLVNTGWSGGLATMPGIKRMPIKATRALLNAALDGSLNNAEFRIDPNFGFEVPVAVQGVDAALLDPRGAWADPEAYDRTAGELVRKFIDNFAQFADHVDESVRNAAPIAA